MLSDVTQGVNSVSGLQLKDKHKQTGGNVGAMEELENAFSLAEESCPGISDKLIAHMVERVQR